MQDTKLYIDCTDVINTDLNTGIQRVSRNIIENRFKTIKKNNVNIQPVCFIPHCGFIKVDGCNKNDLKKKLGYFHYVRLYASEPRRFKKLTKALFPFIIFHNWLDRHWTGIPRLLMIFPLIIIAMTVVPISFLIAQLFPLQNRCNLGEDDILIVPGLSWLDKYIKRGLFEAKSNGCRLAFIIHDLIPLTHPAFCEDSYIADFSLNFLPTIKIADLFVANSKTTKIEFQKYIQNKTSLNLPIVENFMLGAELDLINSLSDIRRHVKDLFVHQAPYICVGTIEPRKNLGFLLNAFEELWANGQNVHLCIIGRYGWKSNELVQRIRNHPRYTKNLTWFEDLDDTELSYCYQNAKALIFPSKVEGFGLPLIEALHYGAPVLASDIPIFREIGANNCAYFSLDNPNDLVSQLIEFESLGKLAKVESIGEFRWPNWEESALEFYEIIIQHFENHEDRSTHQFLSA